MYIIQSIKWNSNQVQFSFIWDIILGYIIAQIYKNEIFYYYEKTTVHLALIGILGWMICLIIPNIAIPLLELLSVDINSGFVKYNIFIFGIQDGIADEAALFFKRNAGFAWEPGRFASLLIIALFLNLVRTKFKLSNNRNFWIILLAIISTQSTTGYISSIIITFIYLYNKKRKTVIYGTIIAIPCILLLLSLPFMGEKIADLWITEDRNEEILNKFDYITNKKEEVIIPQRFDGLLYESLNFIQEPILGYGRPENSFIHQLFNGNLILYNGVLKIFSVFGIIIGILYYLMLIKGSSYYTKINQIKGKYSLFLVFFIINISYYFIYEPIFLSMFFLPYIINIKFNERINNCRTIPRRNIALSKTNL